MGLGDPSTAKSQFLKFVEKTAPVAVYTSGKGSSAAGLTASVIRDPSSHEFYLEGGAMVLADGGVVCIDEFDKMRPEDRVAIHEVMGQQTISIAKAGIATVLSSRVAILAAANPPSGRYDELLSTEENIDLQNTILSRFDMILLMRDDKIEDRDKMIANHICSIHRDMRINSKSEDRGYFYEDEDFLKRYILYARTHCEPIISKKAETLLVEHYLYYRSTHRNQFMGKDLKKDVKNQEFKKCSNLIITVRQLEALIRISEAIARMTLSHEVNELHVKDAIKIYNVSMTQAKSTGIIGEFFDNETTKKQVVHIISIIKNVISINQVMTYERLQFEITKLCN